MPDSEATPSASSAVWGAVEEALRLAFSVRAAWWLGLLVPTFAVGLTLGDGLRISDRLGNLHPFDPVTLELLPGRTRLISPSHLVLGLIWIRIQAQATAGLLAGFDRRNADASAGARARELWHAGGAAASQCFWILAARLGLALLACAVLLGAPWVVLGQLIRVGALEAPTTLAIGALAILTFLYLAVLEVASQLALVSCVSNRRGAISALQHAWKLMQASPGPTLRAAIAHFLLLVAVRGVIATVDDVLGGGLGTVLVGLTIGIAGTVQVCLWDRVYGLLGGWRSLPPLPIGAQPAGADPAQAGPAGAGSPGSPAA